MDKDELMKRCKRGGASRVETARHYFPASNDDTSVKKLRRWIKGDPELRRALRLKGYRIGCHKFPPGVIRVFVDFFGYDPMG